MGYRHLTDFEIQEAIDGTLRREKPLLQLHLDKCELCELRFADYRNLISTFAKSHERDLSAAKVNDIMAHISAIPSGESDSVAFLRKLGWIGSGLSAAAAIGWVVVRTDFLNGVRDLAISYVQSASLQADKLWPMAANNTLAFAGVAAICIMMALDSIIRRRTTGSKLFSI